MMIDDDGDDDIWVPVLGGVADKAQSEVYPSRPALVTACLVVISMEDQIKLWLRE